MHCVMHLIQIWTKTINERIGLLMKKRNIFYLLLLLVIAAIIVGCTSETSQGDDINGESDAKQDEGQEEDQEEASEPSSDVPQEMVFATTSDPVGLSPIETWDTVSDQPINQMYERLFVNDPDTNEFIPHLATSYHNPDDLTWVFELREGVEFHDGTPFNAEAVKYTFETLIDPDVGAPGAHIMSFIDEIEVLGDYEISITTKEPNPNVLTILTNRTTAIISPTADQNQNLMQEPVGTGPFKFENWVQGDRLEMVRNDNYWGEPPPLEKITFLTVPEQSTAISMLETGEVQMIDGIDAEHIPRLESMSGTELLQREATGVYFYAFNMEKEPMNELAFRQAVAYALDIDSYIGLLGGIGFKSHSLFGPAVVGYDEIIEDSGYGYDPDKAREIVEENGYGDEELTLYTSDRGVYLRMAEVAQEQLEAIGLNISIQMLEWGTMLDVTSQGEQDMFVLGSSNSMNGLETAYGYFHSDSVGVNNRSQYSDPDFDALVDEARKELDDDRRQDLLNEAHQRVIEEVFIVPMHHAIATLAHDESLDGVILAPELVFDLREAYRK